MKLIEDEKLGESMEIILDCFSGANTSFVPLCWLLNALSSKKGDKDAEILIDLVHWFASLVKAAEKVK
jgi:hypothetical protein